MLLTLWNLQEIDRISGELGLEARVEREGAQVGEGGGGGRALWQVRSGEPPALSFPFLVFKWRDL
jgi:hypothetical protein